jgi:hypothetical protein
MGDVIELFRKNPAEVAGSRFDVTALAFMTINELRALVRPYTLEAATKRTDLVLLRLLNLMATSLLDPSCTQQTAQAAGWTTLENQRAKGFEILTLVNELWNETPSVMTPLV